MRNSIFTGSRSQSRAVVLMVFMAALMILGAWRLAAHQNPPTSASGKRPPSPVASKEEVRIGEVKSETLPQWLTVTGTVRPEFEAALSTKVSGRVNRVLAREGDVVRRGQPLIQLDARDYDAAIRQSAANLRAVDINRGTAEVTAKMESSLSAARIADANAKIAQSEAALSAANAKLELVQAGPRKQERAQATLAVLQAKSQLALAESNLRRMEGLVNEGAISRQQYDAAKTAGEVAQVQYQTANEAQNMTEEGSRKEEIRVAEQAVHEAQADLPFFPDLVCYKDVMYVRIGIQESVATYKQAAVFTCE